MYRDERGANQVVVLELGKRVVRDTLAVVEARSGVADYYRIVQREAFTEILPGIRTRIWGYNGSAPGPTIEARRGRKIIVTHTNQLGVPTVVHLHGGVTRSEWDGFPTDTVAPGDSRAHQYDNSGRAATLWYHDHSWRSSGLNQYMGLAGCYLNPERLELECDATGTQLAPAARPDRHRSGIPAKTGRGVHRRFGTR